MPRLRPMPALADRLAQRALELVNIPSESRHEAEVAAHVRSIVPRSFEPEYESEDAFVLLGPRREGRPLVVLAGHYDTVPAQGNLPGRIADGAVVGVGASDMKGGLAVMLELPAEQEQRDVDRPGLGSSEVAHELEGDGDAALHVARAAPVHRAVGNPAGNVVLGRHGVVMAGEHEERDADAPLTCPEERLVAHEDGGELLGHERPEPFPDLRLVQALRADVHELERAAAEAVCELAHRAERTVQVAGAYFPP